MKRSARQTRRGHRARRHAEAVNMPAECEAVRSLPPAALQAVLDLCLEYEHLGNPSLCVYCDAILGKATLLDASRVDTSRGEAVVAIGAALRAAIIAAADGGPGGERAIPVVVVGRSGIEIGLLGPCETPHGTVSRFRGAA